VFRDPKGHAENMSELFAMYADGRVKPRISATYPLEQAAEALELMQDRKVLGKVVLTVG
jgi:NADPH2:quinone reductase